RWLARPVTSSRALPAVATQRPSSAVVASLSAPQGEPEPVRLPAAVESPTSRSWVAVPDEAIAAAPRGGRSLAALVDVADELRGQSVELRRLYRTYPQSQPPASTQQDHARQALHRELEQFAAAAVQFDEPLQEGSFKRFLRQVP